MKPTERSKPEHIRIVRQQVSSLIRVLSWIAEREDDSLTHIDIDSLQGIADRLYAISVLPETKE